MKSWKEGSRSADKPRLGISDSQGKGGAEMEKRHISGGSQRGVPRRGLCACLAALIAGQFWLVKAKAFLLHHCHSHASP